MGGTSRISREAYVRFCERLGVKSPGPTRRRETGRLPVGSDHAPFLDSTRFQDHTFMDRIDLATVFLGFARTYYLAGVVRPPLPRITMRTSSLCFCPLRAAFG